MAKLEGRRILRLFQTPEPPDLGPGPRPGVLEEGSLNRALDEAAKELALSNGRRDLVQALALLWHDHLDRAHSIAQDIHDADGSLVHAIMHRREPDYGNAAYWFRRVGSHGAFPELAVRIGALLDSRGEKKLREQLVKAGTWDPFAFVNLCEQASRSPATDPGRLLLREIQATESRVLLDWFCR